MRSKLMKLEFTKTTTVLMILSIILVGCANQVITDEVYYGKDYKISLSKDKKALYVDGDIQRGLTKRLEAMYAPNISTVKAIIYSSSGGYSSESRLLNHFANKNGLSTYAIAYCKGACIAAFMGGVERVAVRGTEFRFYKIGWNTVGIQHSASIYHQNKNKHLFKKQGVKQEFIERIYDDGNGKPLVPSLAELTEANVVSRTIMNHEFNSKFAFLRMLSEMTQWE